MAKTPEQKAADTALEEAVQQVVRAYPTVLQPGSTVVEYLVAIEGIRYDEDGNSLTDVGVAFRDGHCRLTTALGLLTVAHDIMLDQEA